jgi:putative tricarboxylic transport membrane protein
MDFGAALGQGFAILLSPSGLAACIIGLIAGAVVGFLPGISSLGGLALTILLLWPLQATDAFKEPTSVAAFAGAVFIVSFVYGALYGRGLAAINQRASETRRLVAKDLPNQSLMIFGVVAGVMVAGIAGVAGMVAVGWRFGYLGPAEYASIVIFILLAGVAFSSGSITTALAIAVFGLLLSLVGSDPETGALRLTFGVPGLADGINPLVVAVGLFGVASAIYGLDQVGVARGRTMAAPDVPLPKLILKSLIGTPAGLLPTNGAAVVSSVPERRTRSGADPLDPASQTNIGEIVCATIASDLRLSVSLVPVLTLLIGFDAISTLLPNMIFSLGGRWAAQAAVQAAATTKAWLVCATLILLHAVPLTLLAFWKFFRWNPIRIDVRVVAPLILACCCATTYSWNNRTIDIGLMFVFGAIGYFMILANLDRSLLFLGLILGPAVEENVRRAILIARGDTTAFLTRPISAGFLIAGAVVLVAALVWRISRRESPT